MKSTRLRYDVAIHIFEYSYSGVEDPEKSPLPRLASATIDSFPSKGAREMRLPATHKGDANPPQLPRMGAKFGTV